MNNVSGKYNSSDVAAILAKVKQHAIARAQANNNSVKSPIAEWFVSSQIDMGTSYFESKGESIINVNNVENNVNNGIAPMALMESPSAIPAIGDSSKNVFSFGPATQNNGNNAVAANADDFAKNEFLPNEETETNGFADGDDEDMPDYDYDTATDDEPEPTRIAAVRVDFFDNGENSMKGKKKSTRLKANVHVKLPGAANYRKFGCSFNNRLRDFAATMTDEQRADPWYQHVLAALETVREAGRSGEVQFNIAPHAGKLRDENNHTVEHTAVILFHECGADYPTAFVYIDGFEEAIDLNLPPKGKSKCPSLMAVGQFKDPDLIEKEDSPSKAGGVSFMQAMAAKNRRA